MLPARQGSFRLFRLFGIDVYLHWLWLVFALYAVSSRIPRYQSPVWGLLEYLALFLIVLTHEFGHALACRSVGGTANQIVLWPLGGIAFVDTPPRPGAYLWSIAAGPLVNVVLVPVFIGVILACQASDLTAGNEDFALFLATLNLMNLLLLGFNLLPFYPLDGGQLLRGLLWYPFGRARSQLIASIFGLIGVVVLGVVGIVYLGDARNPQNLIWDVFILFFLASNCWRGFVEAQSLRRLEQLPRREGFSCPVCQAAPPVGDFWVCPQCGQAFDPFAHAATCPRCQTVQSVTTCPDCLRASPLRTWDKNIIDV